MNPVYALQKINVWWNTGEIDQAYLHKRIRSEFTDILKSLDTKRITNIVGPTGVGKTSLLYDTISYLLRANVPPERILFFGGDEMTLFGEHRSIGSLLEIYATDILHENLFSFKSPVYILIDDIQFIDDWQIYLLNYMDKAEHIKFIVTQTYLPNDTLPEDSYIKVSVMPLTQQQFAEFYGAYSTLDIDLLRFKSLMPGMSFFDDPAGYYEKLSANVYPLSEYKPYKTKIIDEYLFAGGYPAYFTSRGADWQETLLKTVDHSLYRDIGAACNIKSPQKLKRLLYIIAAHGSNEQSFGSIGHMLYVDTSTIIGYISSLSEGGFAGVAENFSSASAGKEGRVVRKNKRLYLFDTGVCNALLRNNSISAEYDSFVVRSCQYMARRYADENGGRVYFWKDGNRSVDIVVKTDDMLLPILVSYQREYTDKKVKSLKAFMRNYGVKTAIVITKDVLKRDGGIFYIPFWMI